LHADLLTLPDAHEACVADLAFSPDGRRLVTAGGSPFRPQPPDRVCVWDVWGPAAGRCLRELPHPRRAHSLALAEGGRRIVWATADGFVRAADAETGATLLMHAVP